MVHVVYKLLPGAERMTSSPFSSNVTTFRRLLRLGQMSLFWVSQAWASRLAPEGAQHNVGAPLVKEQVILLPHPTGCHAVLGIKALTMSPCGSVSPDSP